MSICRAEGEASACIFGEGASARCNTRSAEGQASACIFGKEGASARSAEGRASASTFGKGASARSAEGQASANLRQRIECKECGGASICQQLRRRSQCKTCKADKDDSMPPDLEELEVWSRVVLLCGLFTSIILKKAFSMCIQRQESKRPSINTIADRP